ncbi:MAG: competence protein CoiA [Muribaculaceae bacterium]|nr:competence protein CoiA [Muribaculaceae bacterium]
MGIEKEAKQKYAITKDGKLTHINDIKNEDVFCPHCGSKLIAKRGNIRIHHFSHDNSKNCSYESYLHSYAKLRIKQWFEESSEIIINYKQKRYCSELDNDCIWESDNVCYQIDDINYNLKKALTECKIEEEVRVGRDYFRADLLWCNPKRPNNNILVEILVTHECTQLKKTSGARIIEFEVHSEEDVERIVTNDIRESDTTHLFGIASEKADNKFKPQQQLMKFVQYKNGSIFARSRCTCHDYLTRLPASLMEITVKTKDNKIVNNMRHKEVSHSLFYKWSVAYIYYLKGFPNCYLCMNHVFDSKNKVMCNLEKRAGIKGTDAQDCINYTLDTELYDKYLRAFKFFVIKNPINIWDDGEIIFHEK